MKPVIITHDDWQSALKESGFGQDPYPEAKTMKDLMAIWKCGPHSAKERIGHLMTQNRAKQVRKTEVGNDGRRQHKNAYLLTETPKGKTK